MRPVPLAMLAALLASGCASPAQVMAYEGRGCTEVGAVVDAEIGKVQAMLPADFRPAAPPNATQTPVVVALNQCTFRAGAVEAREPELFVWAPVEPPGSLRLSGVQHAFELVAHRPAGALHDALRTARPAAQPARFEGIAGEGFTSGADFDVTVRPSSGGVVRVTGSAAPPSRTIDHPEGTCCRLFAQGPGGLVVTDLVSTDQRYGESPCRVHIEPPALADLLAGGGNKAGCGHNEAYDFQARARVEGAQR